MSTVARERHEAQTAGEGPKLYGLLAEFHTVDVLLDAAESVRDAGFTRWDCYSPFAVHGLDGAMGVRRTKLPWVVAGAGATGCAVGLGLQYWTSVVDYPWVISGKPYFSVPAFIPIVFELTILFAAIAGLVAMLGFNKLPQLYHPLFASRRFRRVTDDRFFVAIEADDPRFDRERTRALLESLGAVVVEEVEE